MHLGKLKIVVVFMVVSSLVACKSTVETTTNLSTSSPEVTPEATKEIIPSHTPTPVQKTMNYAELLNKEEPIKSTSTPVPDKTLDNYKEKGITVLGVNGTTVVGVGSYLEVDVKPEKVVRPVVSDMELAQTELIESTSNINGLHPDNFRAGTFIVTAYDLSFASTEKVKGQKGYGVTKSGKSLVGLTWDKARTIAVDENVIPLGTKVYLKFSGERSKYDGVYIASDVGGAIKGRHIDLFLGDFDNYEADPIVMNFGKTYGEVFIVK